MTPCQVARLAQLMVPRPAEHAIALRASTRLLGHHVYLALFVGPERRSPGRLVREDQKRSLLYVLLCLVLACLVALTMMATCATALYLAKSMLGIDVMDGPSGLHQLFYE